MTSSERKALLFLGAVALLGLGARIARTSAASPAATVETRRALLRQIAAVDSARAAKAEKGRGRGEKRREKPPMRSKQRDGSASSDAPPVVLPGTSVYGELLAGPAQSPDPRPRSPVTGDGGHSGAPIDVDVASIDQLEALPGVGPALAHRIAEERARNGPFGGLEALDQRVRGVGPALASRLAPHVTFSGPRRPTSADAGVRSPTGSVPRGRRSSRSPPRAP